MKHLRKLATLIASLLSAGSAHAAGEVQLLSARSNACNPVASCPSHMTTVIEVKNLAYAKQVGVRYRNSQGYWVSAPAQYWMQSSSGKELWNAVLPEPSDAYAIYYSVNGMTYWDNNGGRNYSNARSGPDEVLGAPWAIGDPTGAWSAGTLYGDVTVRNVSPAKEVRIVYTDDNWATRKVGFARYSRTLPSGFEVWTYALPTRASVDPRQVRLAYYVEWSGGNAWDNNFGHDYGLTSSYLIAR